jgi:hypothetical protein
MVSLRCGLVLAGVWFAACKPSAPHPLCVGLEEVAAASAAAADEHLAVLRSTIGDRERVAWDEAVPCPVSVPRFSPEVVWEGGDLERLRMATIDALLSVEGTVELFRSTCGRGDDASQERVIDEARAEIASAAGQNDLLLVVRERVDPVVVSPTTFQPGTLAWDAYVWSYAERRFVCGARGESTNRDEVTGSNRARDIDSLQRDLNRRAINDARGALRAIPQGE